MVTWPEIAKSDQYIRLTPDEKEYARDKYFREIVTPALLDNDPKTDLGLIRKEFDKNTLPSASEYHIDRAKRGAGNIANIAGYSFTNISPSGMPGKERDFARLIGYQGLQAPNKTQRFLGGVTEFGTEAALTAPFVAMSPGSLPGKMAYEALSATAGGLGSEVGGEVGEGIGSRRTGEALGGLLGLGTGFLQGPIIGGIKKGKQSFADREGIFSRAADKRIGNLVSADQKYIDNIIEADTVSGKLGFANDVGFNLAQASDAPGVKSLLEVYEKASPENVEHLIGRQKALEGNLQKAEQQTFDRTIDLGPTGKPPTAAIKESLAETQKSLDKRLVSIEEKQGLLAAKYNRGDPENIGKELKRIRDARANQIKAEIGGKYNSLYGQADQEGLSFDMKNVGKSVVKIFGDDANVFQNPDMPSALSRVYNRYVKKAPGLDLPKPTNLQQFQANQANIAEFEAQRNKASFQELHSLWKLVNKQLPVFYKRGDDNAVRALTEVKNALKVHIDALEEAGTSVGNQFKALNAEYGKRYAEIYKKGAGGKLAAFNRYGDTTPDEKVVESLFFASDKTGGLRDFVKIYGDDPDALQLLRNGALDIFAKKTRDDLTGLFSESKIKGFFNTYKRLLDVMPGLKKELLNVNTRNTALLNRAKTVQAHKANIDNLAIAKSAKTSDVAGLMNFLVTDTKQLSRAYKMSIKNGAGPQFAKSLARTISELPDGFDFLMKNENILKPMFEKIKPGHYENVKTIVKGFEIANRAVPKMGSRAEMVVDPAEKITGTSFASLFSQYRAAQQGRTSYPQIYATMSAKFITKFGFDAVMKATQAALFDPNLAETLARITKAGPIGKKSLDAQFSKHLMTAGIRSASQLTEPSDDGPRWYENNPYPKSQAEQMQEVESLFY